jgi:hypothetical protein
MKKIHMIIIVVVVVVVVIALAVIPIKSETIPSSGPTCLNMPLPDRVDLITGNTIQKESNKLGHKPCPAVWLRLYLL